MRKRGTGRGSERAGWEDCGRGVWSGREGAAWEWGRLREGNVGTVGSVGLWKQVSMGEVGCWEFCGGVPGGADCYIQLSRCRGYGTDAHRARPIERVGRARVANLSSQRAVLRGPRFLTLLYPVRAKNRTNRQPGLDFPRSKSYTSTNPDRPLSKTFNRLLC